VIIPEARMNETSKKAVLPRARARARSLRLKHRRMASLSPASRVAQEITSQRNWMLSRCAILLGTAGSVENSRWPRKPLQIRKVGHLRARSDCFRVHSSTRESAEPGRGLISYREPRFISYRGAGSRRERKGEPSPILRRDDTACTCRGCIYPRL